MWEGLTSDHGHSLHISFSGAQLGLFSEVNGVVSQAKHRQTQYPEACLKTSTPNPMAATSLLLFCVFSYVCVMQRGHNLTYLRKF